MTPSAARILYSSTNNKTNDIMQILKIRSHILFYS